MSEEPQDKAALEILWRGASKFARECRDDYITACKEWGRTHSISQGAWKRFLKAEAERKEAEKRWETAN